VVSIVTQRATYVLIPGWVIAPHPVVVTTPRRPSVVVRLAGPIDEKALVTWFDGCIGSLLPAMREAFSDLRARAEHGQTVVSGGFADQAALYSVLGRLQALGLDLVEVARSRPLRRRRRR
jgi:hypothetical protein